MLKLNCDLGELEGERNIDALIMPYIDQSNIACGGHAGTETSMHDTVLLAKKHNVTIGAHPSYPDKENFGRVSFKLSDEKLIDTIVQQVNDLQNICTNLQTSVQYIKPHGALYNDMMANTQIFDLICQAIKKLCSQQKLPLPLMIQAIKNIQPFVNIAEQYQIPLYFEVFADRAYQTNGLLVPRSQKGAVLCDQQAVIDQITQLIKYKKITTIDHKTIELNADSLCVHGDNKSALVLIRSLKALINEHRFDD